MIVISSSPLGESFHYRFVSVLIKESDYRDMEANASIRIYLNRTQGATSRILSATGNSVFPSMFLPFPVETCST